ncbi:unannotated protein [freshwater metagenome]|uniref:Unannotated protein n=1 Tax=freshwater metagenome TaxID=449393 RepID=A0A6J7BF87_9ZZZZ
MDLLDTTPGVKVRNPQIFALFATDSFAFWLEVGHSRGMSASSVPRGLAFTKARPARVALDDTSKSIIEELQSDGRKSYAAIGLAVGLSEAAVRQRVQRLIDSGVMQIVAVTDPLTVGFNRMAMIGIKVEGDLQDVADQLATFPEVDYVVVTAGSFDLLAEVICEDDDHLLELLQRFRTIKTVRSTESFVYLKLQKQLYNWGTR